MELEEAQEIEESVSDKAVEKRRAKFKEVLRDLAMNTTVHGVAHIVSANQAYKKMRESAIQERSVVDKSNPEFAFLKKFEEYGVHKEQWDLAKSIPTNHLQIRNMLVTQAINEMAIDDILRTGHSIEDMLIHCSIDGMRCNSSIFRHFKSARFGNCYTIQTDQFVATVPGPAFGLTLMLNLDINEYVSPYSSGYGLKLLVHEPGTYPFIEEQGLTLAPTWTFVSLKQKTIDRLGYPHGNCQKQTEYRRKYGMEYTRMTCEQVCLVTLTEDICGCITGFVSMDTTTVASSNKTCGPNIESVCSILVLEAQLNGDLPCPCTNPCSETQYSTTVSSLSWPHDDYLRKELIPLMCSEEHQAVKVKMVTGYDCNEFVDDPINSSLNIDRLRNNFLKLDLYFEELSYEHIEEAPAYGDVQFMSDIGGTIGLFVGASVLSGVELIHLLVECFRYILFRLYNK